MANDGKHERWGAGSRCAPQRRAERAARRSQKRADERRSRQLELFAAGPVPTPVAGVTWAQLDDRLRRDPAMDAMALLHVAAWEFGHVCRHLALRVEEPPCTWPRA